MKKILYFLFLQASLACSGAVSAEILLYYAETSDVDTLLTSANTLALDIPYDSSTWNTVTSATLSLLLSDDQGPRDGNDRVDITTVEGNSIVFGDFQVTGGSAVIWQANGIFNVPTASLIDGMLDFVLKAEIGDFYYHNARLAVNYTPALAINSATLQASSAVPDPGSALLMGTGLALMGLLARRRVA